MITPALRQAYAIEVRIDELLEAEGIEEQYLPREYERLRAQAERELGMTESLAIPTASPLPEAIEKALLDGDLKALSIEHRILYYHAKCKSLGLNPLSRPFAYLTLNGKLQLYALKDAKEQLRKLHGVSLEIVSQERIDTLYLVHVRAKDRDGRTDEDFGFADLGALKGEALGNAMLKAITKGKSRATLSICGLGMIDETEVASLPDAVIEEPMSPAVERAMDRFHAAMPPSEAVEVIGTVIAMPEKVPARPFVETSPTSPVPQAAPSMATQPASGGVDSKKPETKSPGSSTHQKMGKPQLLQAIKANLDRLSDGDEDIRRHLLERISGEKDFTVTMMEAVAPVYLRPMLAKLEPMEKEQPPADPTEVSAASTPSAETLSASNEEDIPHFPPPDGNHQEGLHVPPGETLNNGSTQGGGADLNVDLKVFQHVQCTTINSGIRCVREWMHTGNHYFTGPRPEDRPAPTDKVTPPDAPTLINGHVSVGDVRALDLYAVMCEHRDIFDRMTAELPWNRKEAAPMITLENWEAIIDAIQENAEVRS